MPANQRMQASRRPQEPASIAFCSALGGFAVAQAVQRRDPGLEIAGVWRMSAKADGRSRATCQHPVGLLAFYRGSIRPNWL
jgi:hypothetical protein